MELQLNLSMPDNTQVQERLKDVQNKKKASKFEPSWEQVWYGYVAPTGTVKKGIYQTKLSDADRQKLDAVKMAIENGELGTGVESLSKFTKTRALGLYKDLQLLKRGQIIDNMVANKPDNYHLITDVAGLGNLIELLESEKIIAVDTETTGVDVFHDDVIVGISLTLPDADYHCYIPVRHTTGDKQLNPATVFDALKPFLEDENLKKVLHNSKFDIHMLRKEGINMQGLYMDTMVAMALLNENEPSFALKNLATKYGKYFGFEDKSATYEELFGKGGFEGTPLDIGTIYACKDTHLTYKFHMWIMEQFNRLPEIKKLYFDVELPITVICIEMEKNGLMIDMEFAKQYQAELQAEVQDLENQIKVYFGDININSNQQLASVIYDVMGLEDISGGRKVDAPTLKKLASKSEGIKKLLEYRELNKLLTTYIEPLPQKIASDGRLHGSYNQTATVTGRFASNNPNLQNIPYKARKMFVAPKGKIIIGSDFSQIEPRFLAHISGDADFKQAYIDGRDLYSEIASSTFKRPIEECGDGSKWRKMAKVVLLGNMYGISAMSLAEQFGITLQEAEQIYTDFLNAYPRMAQWFKEVNAFANTNGYVQTAYGRKRRFLGHTDVARKFEAVDSQIKKIVGSDSYDLRNDKRIPYNLKKSMYEVRADYNRVQRQSINAIIQGSSADIMKIAMCKIYEYIKDKPDWKLTSTIHDEILIEIPDDTPIDEIEKIAEIQRTAVELSIPMKCDVEVSQRWGEGMSFADWIKNKQN